MNKKKKKRHQKSKGRNGHPQWRRGSRPQSPQFKTFENCVQSKKLKNKHKLILRSLKKPLENKEKWCLCVQSVGGQILSTESQ